jgi:hypothetical protein
LAFTFKASFATMKKFFQFLFILIGIVTLAILVLGLIEPTDVCVSRTVMIRAPRDTVFEQIVKFKNWPNWSPWQKLDPGMKTTYMGIDGQAGSGYHWAGDENKVGEGEMMSDDIGQTQMKYQFHVIKPWQLDATGVLTVKDTINNMEKVTWTITKHTSYPFNAMSMFLDMDKLMGPDFEKGLQNMKSYVESRVTASSFIEIKQIDYPAQIFEGLRKTISWDDRTTFFNAAYQQLAINMTEKITGPATGLFYTWDTITKTADVAAAFPVTDTSGQMKGISVFQVAASKAYMAVEKGGYAAAGTIHNALRSYVARKGEKTSLVIEEYKVSPKQEPDSNKWVTDIYYLVY